MIWSFNPIYIICSSKDIDCNEQMHVDIIITLTIKLSFLNLWKDAYSKSNSMKSLMGVHSHKYFKHREKVLKDEALSCL